jgi:molybdate transport system substrate-binding protein
MQIKGESRIMFHRRLLLAAVAAVLIAGPAAAETKVTVFAAASLTDALGQIATAYKAETGTDIVASYAASSTLAKQIEQGAPAEIFISADNDWMDYVEGKNLMKPGTRQALLGNRLVLVAAADKAKPVDLKKGVDVAALVGSSKLAMGMVASVPAGKYGKTALTNLGAWDAVAPKVAETESVRAALTLVARGEAAYGIVYETDAAVEPKVKVVGVFPADSHPPIVYPIGEVKEAGAAATAFRSYLAGPKAAATFQKFGFTVLAK